MKNLEALCELVNAISDPRNSLNETVRLIEQLIKEHQ